MTEKMTGGVKGSVPDGIRKSICPYDCPSTCGFLTEVKGGRIVKVKNDPDHPVSKNGICRKAQHYEKSIYSEKRIRTPLKRKGTKGSGDFVRISWEEAVGEIRDKWKHIIQESGPDAILPWYYSGVMSDIQSNCGDAFFNRMGAAALTGALCAPARSAGYRQVAGRTGCLDPNEINDSDFYIIWGSNMAATRIQALADLVRPQNKGKKKILIDTYANPSAKYFDETILIKAGTDGALALAMMHVLDAEGLSDEEFLSRHTEGYEAFRKTLRQYSPEWAEKVTGISPDIIRGLAREYAAAKAPVIIPGSGLSRYGNGGMTVRLIVILSLFTGAWQYPGGGLCGCTPIDTDYVNLDLIKRPDFRQNSAGLININRTGSALTMTGDKKIRSLYVYGGNPANTVGSQDKVIEGLKREDLFTVVHERFMTETALYADIILPATFSVEQYDIYRCYGYCTLGTALPVTAPLGECKSNWDTFCLLAEAMGYEDDYFRRSEEEMLRYILDHPMQAVRDLPEEKKQILREGGSIAMPYSDHMKIGTPSGKFLIVNEQAEDPVPCYRPSFGNGGLVHGEMIRKEAAEAYPLKLIASPSRYTLNSEFRDQQDLLDLRGEQKLIIHTDDAAVRGISNGDMIAAFNDRSEVLFRADVREDIAPGNLVCEGVFRRDQCQGGRAFNALTSERLSDLAEGTTLNDNCVEIRRLL